MADLTEEMSEQHYDNGRVAALTWVINLNPRAFSIERVEKRIVRVRRFPRAPGITDERAEAWLRGYADELRRLAAECEP